MSEAPATPSYTGVEKAAIIMLALGDERGADLLKHFDSEEVTQLSIAMVRMRTLTADMVEDVIEVFFEAMKTSMIGAGGLEYTEKLLRRVLPADQADAILAEVANATNVDIWRKLSNVDRGMLVAYLKGEHPQTAALILSQLSPELGARLLKSFDRDMATDIINRMLRLQPVQSEAWARVEEALRVEFLATTAKRRRQDRHAGMAEIFNSLDSRTEAELMEELARVNPDAAEKVQHLMFTFKDLLTMDAASVQTLIQAGDKEVLSRALRNADEALKLLFLSNMSTRAAKRMEEEWIGVAPLSRSDSEAAQTALLKTAKALIAKGEIRSTRERDDDEDVDL